MKSNFKKALSLALILMMVVSTMVIMPLTANAAEAGTDYTGSGTEADPYVILTADGFVALMGTGSNLTGGKHWKLGTDIDMTGVEYKPNKLNDSNTYVFDGNGKTLTGLAPTENSSSSWGLGALFTQTKGAVTIKNLTVVGLSISTSAKKYSGGLVGYSSSGTVTITDCNASGSVEYSGTTASCVGGLVSYQTAANSYFENCVVDVDVIVSAAPASGNVKIGGIVGNLENPGTFKNCKSTGTVAYTGEEYTAGTISTGEIWGTDEKGTSVVINDTKFEATFELRLKLTDDFGFMVIAEGVEGFVFTTDAEADVTTLDRVAGAVYNESETKVYATYTDLTASGLDTTIYFAAYATVDGELQFTELKAINVYEVAKELQDGKLGDATVTTDVTEMALYVKMCEYYEAYKAYLIHIEGCKHVYDNDCDADCNECGEERTPADHAYDNACDADCYVCGATRIPADHAYDNACDADCNVCGAERTPADHAYDNACDADCNVCGATRIPADHVYDNACDADCNVCGAGRTPADHVYDNACDKSCNECGAERTVGDHVYTDGVCDECGVEENVDFGTEVPF